MTLGEMDGSHEGGQINFNGAGSNQDWYMDLYDHDFRIFTNYSSTVTVQMFNIGSGATNLTLDGSGTATAWNTTSDKRIKTNVKEINYGLNDIMLIKPVGYEKHQVNGFVNGEPKLGKTTKEIGFIAQDLYKIIPEIVYKPADETKELWAVDYSKLVPVLVKAIQEQEQKIEAQQKLINKLLKQNAEILNKINTGE